MSRKVCLLARTLGAPTAGGHAWVYLNWALGLQALGCRVIWLEAVSAYDQLRSGPRAGRGAQGEARLVRIARLALASSGRDPLPAAMTATTLDLDGAAEADLFLDMAYAPADVVSRFRRSALLDIDPGLYQLWVSRAQIDLPHHHFYFTIGETVGRPDARFPDCGVEWRHLPPCVFLDLWPVSPTAPGSPFTTVSNWIMNDYWVDDDQGGYANDKRAGFLPFLDLPKLTDIPLELALSLGGAHGGASGSRAARLARPGGTRDRRDAARLPALHSAVRWRVQLRETLMCPDAERMDQRPYGVLSRKRETGRRAAHRRELLPARFGRAVSFF